MRGLGPYVRFIPAHDQETIVLAVSANRQNAVHRGMLLFIPIDEIEDSLRGRGKFEDTAKAQAQYYNTQMQQMQAQAHYQQMLAQQSVYQQYNNPYSGNINSNTTSISTLGSGGYIPVSSSTPYQPTMHIPSFSYPNSQDCQFAYSSLMVARAMMLNDGVSLELDDKNENSQNSRETLAEVSN